MTRTRKPEQSSGSARRRQRAAAVVAAVMRRAGERRRRAAGEEARWTHCVLCADAAALRRWCTAEANPGSRRKRAGDGRRERNKKKEGRARRGRGRGRDRAEWQTTCSLTCLTEQQPSLFTASYTHTRTHAHTQAVYRLHLNPFASAHFCLRRETDCKGEEE